MSYVSCTHSCPVPHLQQLPVDVAVRSQHHSKPFARSLVNREHHLLTHGSTRLDTMTHTSRASTMAIDYTISSTTSTTSRTILVALDRGLFKPSRYDRVRSSGQCSANISVFKSMFQTFGVLSGVRLDRRYLWFAASLLCLYGQSLPESWPTSRS